MSRNLGLLYSKEYFKGFSYSFGENDKFVTTDAQNSIAKNNKILFDEFFLKEIESVDNSCSFSLKTIYPGLFTGSGYQHSVDGDDEFKIGFFFDFTSGQPLIPGSSVKGALRAVFPGRGKKHKSEKVALIQFFFEECLKLTKPNLEEIKKIEEEIFEGKRNGERINIYKADIFHDAVLSNSNLNKKFLGNDYITPHNENPLRNPTPLQFLKVLPEIEFNFRFKLQDSIEFPTLTKEKKLELFKTILLFRGIGAKTNVGYGQFSETKLSPIKQEPKEGKSIIDLIIEPSGNSPKLLSKGSEWEGKIIDNKREQFIIQVEVNGEVITMKKNSSKFKNGVPKVGNKVKIVFNDNYSKENPNFTATILPQ